MIVFERARCVQICLRYAHFQRIIRRHKGCLEGNQAALKLMILSLMNKLRARVNGKNAATIKQEMKRASSKKNSSMTRVARKNQLVMKKLCMKKLC